MDDVNNVTHEEHAAGTREIPILRPNFLCPENVWKEVKKAAIDEGVSPSQWLVAVAMERLGIPTGEKGKRE